MFRSIPYQKEISENQIWQRNLMRIADVWMGDFKKYFYSSTMVRRNLYFNNNLTKPISI